MEQNRRAFLKDSISVTAGLAAPMFVPRSAFGANDRITYGVIGTGNRARWLNTTFQKLGAQCVALCDVYDQNLELARQDSPADAKPYLDYNDLLAQPGLDCVVVGTPDHQHMPNLFASLKAGKDVYLEKPLSMSLDQSKQMIETVRKTDRIVEIGMHRRSMPFIYAAKKLFDDGVLGKVSMVMARWNWHFDMPLDNSPLPGKLDWDRFQGTIAHRDLEPMRFRWWRGFWAYSGGNMTDQGTHLMDVVQWMTGAKPPKSAVCQGYMNGVPGAEVPNVFSAAFEYDDFMATWTLNYRSSYEYDWSIHFQGEKASMVLDRKGYRIYGDPGLSSKPWSQPEASSLKLVDQQEDKDSAAMHPQNFLECVRSRKQPNCTIAIAAAAVTGPHMANIAYREGRKVKLNPDGTAA